MMDIKINGNTYNDVERVRLVRADGLGVYQLSDATVLDCEISNTDYDGEYYNSVVTKIGKKWSFAKLKKINLPSVTSVVMQVFYGTGVVEVRLPALLASPSQMFLSCGSLKKAIFGPHLAAFGQQEFRACQNLETLVLPYNGVVSFTNTTAANAFKDSAVAAGTAYVYVPASQVDAYKADDQWGAYADQIRAIEDYPDEVV